jgi:hypothetical protein
MKAVRCVLSCCLLLLLPSPGHSDACSDLQAGIAKETALKQEMVRVASPYLTTANMPVRNEGVCKAAETLRTHIVTLIGQMDSKCLNDEQYRELADRLGSSMKMANSNIGLFCN